jgi:hypothetical protein
MDNQGAEESNISEAGRHERHGNGDGDYMRADGDSFRPAQVKRTRNKHY